MRYVFTIQDHKGDIQSIVVRKRIDHAKFAAHKLIYQLLRDLALLDRPIARDALHWVSEWNSCDPKGSFKLGDKKLSTHIDYEPIPARG